MNSLTEDLEFEIGDQVLVANTVSREEPSTGFVSDVIMEMTTGGYHYIYFEVTFERVNTFTDPSGHVRRSVFSYKDTYEPDDLIRL